MHACLYVFRSVVIIYVYFDDILELSISEGKIKGRVAPKLIINNNFTTLFLTRTHHIKCCIDCYLLYQMICNVIRLRVHLNISSED